MNRCLLVDDDPVLRQAVSAYLGRFGFRVDTADTGRAMRDAVQASVFDIVLLDVLLPDESGLDLCRWFRRSHATPLVMLGGHDDPVSRVLGLELGADDVVPKPFEPRELVARLNAVLRRVPRGGTPARAMPARRDRFDGWSFDRLQRLLVSPAEQVVPLSNAEFRLLAVFVDHPRQVLARDRLVALTAGPGLDVSERSVDLAVHRLRRKLAASPGDRVLIRTVRGEGYRFDGDTSG